MVLPSKRIIVHAATKTSQKKKGTKKQRKQSKINTRAVTQRSITNSAPIQVGSIIAQLSAMKTSNLSKTELKNYGSGIRCVGSELGPSVGLADPNYSSSIGTGTDMAYLDLTPSAWDGTRVQVQAGLWEKYKINKLILEFIPTATTLQAGGFVMAIDNDWEDEIPSVDLNGVRRMCSFEPSLVVPAFRTGPASDFMLEYRDLPGRRVSDSFFTGDPYTSTDPRLTAAGWFGMKAIQSMSGSGIYNQFGYIVIHYDISFYIADLSPSVSAAPEDPNLPVEILPSTPVTAGQKLSLVLNATQPSLAGKLVNFTPFTDVTSSSQVLLKTNRLYAAGVNSTGSAFDYIWDAASEYVGNANFGFVKSTVTGVIDTLVKASVITRPLLA